ncbi:PilN domain-containing protein [Patescibacteria group bacterium]
MPADINLIPQAEIKEQKKTKAIKGSTVFFIVFLLVVLAVGGYFFYITNNLKSQVSSLDGEINTLRADIVGLSDVEISARNLDKKYVVLNTLFSERLKYSLLLKELGNRKPSDLEIQSLDIKPSSMNVSGVADNYISIANFVNSLVNNDFEDGLEGLKEVFISVSLNSVSLEGTTNKVKFFIVVEYDIGKIKS